MKGKKFLKSAMALALAFLMLPINAFAAVDFDINGSDKNDGYYNVISKQDWDIAPGITESEIVLNNDDGSRRQVLHIMEADTTNEYVKVTTSYMKMTTDTYQVGNMMEQAEWVEENWGWNVVGGMNTCLSWYSGYASERVNEPLGFMMIDAEVFFDPANCGYQYGNVGFPSCLVINKDVNDEGEERPSDIPKVEMVQIRSASDLDGWEEQVIPASSGFIVKEGVNQYSSSHSDAAPRSVVGIKEDGTVVIMENDGRQAPFSTGMSMYELAEVMVGLGCTYAVNCDGGGSSTFISERPGEGLKVNNSPSDGSLRSTTSGILFISTAPSTDEFVRAELSSEYDYYTPNSEVQFDAVATNLVGKKVDLPEDATWQLADDSYGTITNDGLFTSNGKVGQVTVQIFHDGKVKGEKEISVVWPTDFAFSTAATAVPYGKTIPLEFVATYNGSESYVALKEGDISFVLDEPSIGTISGFSFTSTSDETTSATSGTITATINGLASTFTINLGKGSEILFDFEGDNVLDEWILRDYNVEFTGAQSSHTNDAANYPIVEGALEQVSTKTGKVHSGDNALAVTVDYADAKGNGWIQYRLFFDGEHFEVSNPKKIGFWFWMPEEAYANEIDMVLCYVDATGNIQRSGPVVTDIGYCMNNQDEAGWRYFTVDISNYPTSCFGWHEGSARQFYIQFYNYQQQWQKDNSIVNTQGKFTYFIDDITIEYSDAADDADAPTFGTMYLVDNNGSSSEMKGQTIKYNTIGAEVSVADVDKSNASGINVASAKAYIDGHEVDCKYTNGRLSVSDITVADGLHSVKFTICDNMGNMNSIIRQVNVDAGSDIPTVNLVAHDEELTNLPADSVYYVDLVASEIETVQKLEVDLDLVNTFGWELEHADVLDGFELSYSVEKYENVATITINKTGKVDLTGSQIVASIPVRVWEPKIDYGALKAEKLKEVYLTIKATRGILECVDGTISTFTCDPMKVGTELYMNQWNTPDGFESVTLHKHTAVELEDKEATCTANGYTGRTFCEVCNSVVDWGTKLEAKGHDWKVVDGKLTCNNGGELFNGEYTDGKTYVNGEVIADGWNSDNTAYYKDGVKLTGTHVIDKAVYTFNDKGEYLPNRTYEGFIESEEGMMYFYTNTNYEEKYVYLNNVAYYFVDGIARDGKYTINGEECLFEDGKYVSCSTADIIDAGWEGDAVDYIIYSDGSMVLGGEGEAYKYTSRAQLPWVKFKTDIRSIFIGKDITSIGQFGLADIYYADSITFEEGSSLKYIGAGAFLSIYNITEIVLPDSLETIMQNAFKMCKKLESVYLPQDITYIHKLAFVNNANVVMEKIYLNVAKGTYAETYANEYNIPHTVRDYSEKTIASGTCGDSAKWELTSSGKMTISGSGAMYDYADQTSTPWAEYLKQIKEIVIGKDITVVGNYAFGFAHNVEKVTFEEGSKLEKIGAVAFYYMLYVTEVEIPESVKTIGNLAFAYCRDLTNVYTPQDATLIYPKTFNKSSKVVLNVAEGSYAETYAKANGYAYTTRDYVDKVIATGTCGDTATWELTSGGKLTISGSGVMYDYANQEATPWAAYLKKIKEIVIGKDITAVGQYAFGFAHYVEKVTFEEGSKLEKIGAVSFYYMLYVTEVEIPESVKTIGNLAFAYCSDLTSVYVPQDVTLIYPKAFNKSSNVVLNVAEGSYAETYAKTNEYAYTTRTYNDVIVASGTCGESATWELTSGGKLTISGSGAMDNYANQEATPWAAYLKKIKEIVIGKDITAVGQYAFGFAHYVEKVTFEEGSKLEKIGAVSFYYMLYVTEVDIPDSVTNIGNLAFGYCKKLVNVTLPNNEDLYIHTNAFKNSGYTPES